jgi:hypothetical protein
MGTSDGFDPKSRELCPDGACIGVIGPDGTCKECGKVSPTATQDPRHRGMRSEEQAEEELERARAIGSFEPPPEEFDDRELCPDGACIGVIGPDGRCKECGAASARA